MKCRSCLAALVLAFLVLALPLTGCLDTQRKLGLTYDASKDEFHVLRLYYNIRAENNDDLKHLVALYNNRDHILLYDPVALLTESAAVRLEDGKIRNFSLGQPPAALPEVTSTEGVDTRAVIIQPGKFFLSPDKAACYYQQMIVPGAVIDQLLKHANETIPEMFTEQLNAELKQRADGAAVSSIDELKTLLEQAMDKQAAAAAPGASRPADAQSPSQLQSTRPLAYLSNDSVKALKQACDDGTFAASRKGSVVTLAVQLSPADAKALKTDLEEIKTHARDAIQKIADPIKQKQAGAALDLLNQLVVSDPKDGKFTISLDAIKFVEHATAAMAIEKAWNPVEKDKAAQYTTVVDGLQANGVVIDPTLQLDQILPAFAAGTLAVDPPAKSVPPGTGIFPDAPATQPNAPAPG